MEEMMKTILSEVRDLSRKVDSLMKYQGRTVVDGAEISRRLKFKDPERKSGEPTEHVPVSSVYKARNLVVRIDHIARHSAVKVSQVRQACETLGVCILKDGKGRYTVPCTDAVKISWYFKMQ